MSFLIPTPLYEVAPLISDDPISTQFMLKDLARSGLVPEDLDAYPTKSAIGVGVYIIPYQVPYMWTRRIDSQTNKYIGPPKITDLYIPKNSPLRPAEVVYLVEGEKKGAKLFKSFPHLKVICMRGCSGYSQNKTLHPTLINFIHGAKTVVAVFDADIETNVRVGNAAHTLKILLDPLHIELQVVKPPLGKGADDWLVEDSTAELTDLVPVDLAALEMGRKHVLATAKIFINEKGEFDRNETNAASILKVYLGKRAYVDKRLGLIVDGSADTDLERFGGDCVEYIQSAISGKYKMPAILWGLERALMNEQVDLVKDLILSLKWDGIKRLDTWGSEYLPDVRGPALASDWGRMLIRALTNRIVDPGCQADTIFAITGSQGTHKSTFLEDLGTFDGRSFYYALDVLPMGDTTNIRYRQVACSMSVVVDMAEGKVLDTYKQGVENLKQFVTQRMDTIQVLYKGKPQKAPRGFILTAATNRTDFIADSSGTRRFTTLITGPNDIPRLPYDVKCQLIAEAVACPDDNWFKERVSYEDVPEEVRTANPHLKNVRELLNLEHTKYDGMTDFVIQLIQSKDIPIITKEGKMWLTVKYVVDRWNENSRDTAHGALVAKQLTGAMSSPTFPYKLTKVRRRLQQLTMTDWQKNIYSSGIGNLDSASFGYLIEDK